MIGCAALAEPTCAAVVTEYAWTRIIFGACELSPTQASSFPAHLFHYADPVYIESVYLLCRIHIPTVQNPILMIWNPYTYFSKYMCPFF